MIFSLSLSFFFSLLFYFILELKVKSHVVNFSDEIRFAVFVCLQQLGELEKVRKREKFLIVSLSLYVV